MSASDRLEESTPRVPRSAQLPGLSGRAIRRALRDAVAKLNPAPMSRNPVMFIVEIGSVATTVLWIQAVFGTGEAPAWFIGSVSLWLWLTVFFAAFSESLAEGRGKAQAEALRKSRRDVPAKRMVEPRFGSTYETVPSASLRKGDVVFSEAGDIVPCDGEVIEGIASVDESADHGGKRARHPGIGRRPKRRDGRDQGSLGLARDPCDDGAGCRIP